MNIKTNMKSRTKGEVITLMCFIISTIFVAGMFGITVFIWLFSLLIYYMFGGNYPNFMDMAKYIVKAKISDDITLPVYPFIISFAMLAIINFVIYIYLKKNRIKNITDK